MMRIVRKFFVLCLLGMYIFGNKIKAFKEKVKGHKVFNMFRISYRYTDKILLRIESRIKRTFVSVFVKGMKFYG